MGNDNIGIIRYIFDSVMFNVDSQARLFQDVGGTLWRPLRWSPSRIADKAIRFTSRYEKLPSCFMAFTALAESSYLRCRLRYFSIFKMKAVIIKVTAVPAVTPAIVAGKEPFGVSAGEKRSEPGLGLQPGAAIQQVKHPHVRSSRRRSWRWC